MVLPLKDYCIVSKKVSQWADTVELGPGVDEPSKLTCPTLLLYVNNLQTCGAPQLGAGGVTMHAIGSCACLNDLDIGQYVNVQLTLTSRALEAASVKISANGLPMPPPFRCYKAMHPGKRAIAVSMDVLVGCSRHIYNMHVERWPH